jgi:hypothetical protein
MPAIKNLVHFNAAEHLNADPCAREPRVPLMVVFQTAKLRRGVRMFRATWSTAGQSPDYHNLNNKFCLRSAPVNHQREARCRPQIGAGRVCRPRFTQGQKTQPAAIATTGQLPFQQTLSAAASSA